MDSRLHGHGGSEKGIVTVQGFRGSKVQRFKVVGLEVLEERTVTFLG